RSKWRIGSRLGQIGRIGLLKTTQDAKDQNEVKDLLRDSERIGTSMNDKFEKTDAQWREQLSPEQFNITRRKGTERAFTGAYWDCKDEGTYRCVCCDQPLFDSDTKFESGTGWPSFWAPAADENVTLHADNSHGMRRTEVTCRRCGAHLGHIFNDGPKP